ncbi:glycosyltransferase family 4 protein [Opitutales bacterium]|nr:glycosyltransferase family 4 protein [Opitutales bacterium]
MKKIKVIQLVPELNSGGVERGTLELGKYLSSLGHESIVISNGGRLVSQLEQEGSRHVKLPIQKKNLSSFFQIKALGELFREECPDIIHMRSRVPAWIGYLAWRKLDPSKRPRLITTVHGFYSVNAYSKIMTRGERVICVSNSVCEYVLTNYPDIPKEKLTVIHRGVDPAQYHPTYRPAREWLNRWQHEHPQLAGKSIITLPGRITRWKGQLDFIQIIAALKAKGLPVHALLVGEAHPRKLDFLTEVKNAIREAGLQNDITLTEHRTDLRDILAISNTVVSCSTDPEAFGRVTLEALSLGKPVAAYAHGGVAEQLDQMLPIGKIPVGDITSMVNLLADWIASISPPTPTSTSEFELQQMLSSTLGLYEELL